MSFIEMIILRFVPLIFQIYKLLLIAHAIMSWFPDARYSDIGRLIDRWVEPYLSFFDQMIPSFAGISFSVVIGILVLQLIERGVLHVLLFLLKLF